MGRKRRFRPTRADYLTGLLDAHYGTDNEDAPYVEFVPFRGWWLRPPEVRYFGDEGDYMGANWREAEENIKWVIKIQ